MRARTRKFDLMQRVRRVRSAAPDGTGTTKVSTLQVITRPSFPLFSRRWSCSVS